MVSSSTDLFCVYYLIFLFRGGGININFVHYQVQNNVFLLGGAVVVFRKMRVHVSRLTYEACFSYIIS